MTKVRAATKEESEWAEAHIPNFVEMAEMPRDLVFVELKFRDVPFEVEGIEVDYLIDGPKLVLRFWDSEGGPVDPLFNTRLEAVKETFAATFDIGHLDNVVRAEGGEATTAFCVVVADLVTTPDVKAVSWVLKKIQATPKG